MDFLDVKKSRARQIRLITGYILLAIALCLATVVLLYQASGFGVSSSGQVIQNGLVFVSSNPSGAAINLNGQPNGNTTNSRLTLQSGTYTMRLTRDGYRDWQRSVTVEGGGVERIDYPFLVPRTLTPAGVDSFDAAPLLLTQSPDRRWLVAQSAADPLSFSVYDSRDPARTIATKQTIKLPASAIGLPTDGQPALTLQEWSRDNDHLLLKHAVGNQVEYIMLSRSKPDESFNLTKRLQLAANDQVTLRDKKYDRYFIHDATAQTLSVADLDNPTAKPYLSGVVAYKSYGDNVVLYATTSGADTGKTAIKLYQDDRSYPIRQVASSDRYLLDVSTFKSDWYVAVGSTAESNLHVYKNPAQSLQRDVTQAVAPVDILKMERPDYVEFSANSQFVMVQSGQRLAVYDTDNERSFTYSLQQPLDAPQRHATWLDGAHLTMVSDGKAVMFDFDGTNVQSLSAATPTTVPYFDTSYKTLYTLHDDPSEAGKSTLSATPLRTERDR